MLNKYSDLQPASNYPIRPQELVDYKKLSRTDRLNVQDKLFKLDVIEKYLDDKWDVELFNVSEFEKLILNYEFYYKILTEGEKVLMRQTVMVFVKHFKLLMPEYYQALKINYEVMARRIQLEINAPEQANWDD